MHEAQSGTVIELLPGKLFQVRLSEGDAVVVAGLSEEFGRTHVRVKQGDEVKVVRSQMDPSRARIVAAKAGAER